MNKYIMYVFRFSLPVKLGINYLQLDFKYFNNNIKIILTRYFNIQFKFNMFSIHMAPHKKT